jgi:hypothetical protein
MLTFYPSRIPDPGVKKAPDPGSGYATLVLDKEGKKVLCKKGVLISLMFAVNGWMLFLELETTEEAVII